MTGDTYVELRAKIESQTARVVVMGLGYAGLPMALAFARAGYPTVGLDVDPAKVAEIGSGRTSVGGVDPEQIRQAMEAAQFRATTDSSVLADADVVSVCVPTGIDELDRPDLRSLELAMSTVASWLAIGRPTLVVVESSVPPGTTRALAAALEGGKRQTNASYFVAHSPERIDPGNPAFSAGNTPRVVGGVTEQSADLAATLYESVVGRVARVSTVEVAEMTKALENTFRFVNVSLVNELTIACDRLGVDVWETIDAAATKPYGFMVHYPGPGVGGACIPIIPHFLGDSLLASGRSASSVSWATDVNRSMPDFVADKVVRLVLGDGSSTMQPSRAIRVLLIGVTYKPDLPDLRSTPAGPVARALRDRGARVEYHDPHVSEWSVPTRCWKSDRHSDPPWLLRSVPLTDSSLAAFDCAVILTPHSSLDYGLIDASSRLVLDTRNAYRGRGSSRVVRL